MRSKDIKEKEYSVNFTEAELKLLWDIVGWHRSEFRYPRDKTPFETRKRCQKLWLKLRDIIVKLF